MKVAFWVMFYASVLSRSRALDCEDSACLNILCPLMKGPLHHNMFKCPRDNYCMTRWIGGAEKNACEYCPQGGNETLCSEYFNEIAPCGYTSCNSNVTKFYQNYQRCDGVDSCPNKSDEKECLSLIHI